MNSSKPTLKILLAKPRGFCAGVDRAIQIVERALKQYGPPVYVRHEIVHNRFVVENLEAQGAVFVDELDEVPDGVPVIFSAHGVARAVVAEANARDLHPIDATCPLVTKVHREADRHHAAGQQTILIGHAGHPEVVGTMGQVPPDSILLVETREQAETLEVADPNRLAYITQTTLSIDDTTDIIDALKGRFPHIKAPHREDICYATTNRQQAVKAIAGNCEALFVIGAPNSSNSLRLVEVAARQGCRITRLVQRAANIDWALLDGVATLGLTAGASAPEELVEEVIAACGQRFAIEIEEIAVTHEDTVFKLPPDGRT